MESKLSATGANLHDNNDADRGAATAGSRLSAQPRIGGPAIEIVPHLYGHDRAADAFGSDGPRAGRTLVRFLLAACIGIAGTLAWQSEAARRMIATYVPTLGSLSQGTTPSLATAPDAARTQTPPAAPASPELAQEIKAVARDLAAVRQSVDRLAASQEQMSRTIAKLQASEEELRQKLATPAPPARKPETRPPQGAPQMLAPGPRPLSRSFTPSPGPPPPQPPAEIQ